MELLSRLLHEQGKNSYEKDFKEIDPATWPAEWSTTYYKTYPRFPAIKLPEPRLENTPSLMSAIRNRRSDRNFTGGKLNLDQLSTLLKYSCGEIKLETDISKGGYRAQASGGARFPIEMYVLLFASTGIEPGVYHYNVKDHSLEYMWAGQEMFDDKSLLMKSTWTKDASALLVMTGVFWRTQNKYHARGYRMICIEAGSIIQNIYLLAGSLGLKCVAFAGTNDDKIEELLGLDTEVESLVMSTVIGT